MPPRIEDLLTAENGYLFRITHRDNIPWILNNGLLCAADQLKDPAFVTIGSSDLIDKRSSHPVPVPPGGTLAEYIPFYFTPFSPMAYNIHTGRQVTKRPNEEIVILMTSVDRIVKSGLAFVFTDRHAYLEAAIFSSDPADLTAIDFKLLSTRNFQRSEDDPGRVERYQAEFLVHRSLPLSALWTIACYTTSVQQRLEGQAARLGVSVRCLDRPGWYF